MATNVQENLVSENASYEASFTKGHLALRPVRKYAVGLFAVTCMDARIDPMRASGIKLGDAHVTRNAGGSARDALRSLVISQQQLGTCEVMVIKHTDCGMQNLNNAAVMAILKKNLGEAAVRAAKQAFGGDFQPFTGLEEAVKADVALLKDSPLIIKGAPISGWVYEIGTGKVRHVI